MCAAIWSGPQRPLGNHVSDKVKGRLSTWLTRTSQCARGSSKWWECRYCICGKQTKAAILETLRRHPSLGLDRGGMGPQRWSVIVQRVMVPQATFLGSYPRTRTQLKFAFPYSLYIILYVLFITRRWVSVLCLHSRERKLIYVKSDYLKMQI